MNMSGSSDAERRDFFERARQKAEEDWRRNNSDAGALTRWGGALLELANFMPGEEASSHVNEAVAKFQQALAIDSKKDDTLWCLGNAYTSQGFLCPQKADALQLFDKAKKCFDDALAQKPENVIYKKGLEMTKKAPDLYDEIQKQLAPPRIVKQGTFWMDVLGYVTVVGLLFGISYLVSVSSPAAKPNTPSP